MEDHVFPRKPYEQVVSETIREEIRQGSFDDLEYRRYVNELVGIEWYTTDWDSGNSTGISAFGVTVGHWRRAAMFPELYDRIRDDLGASTRADHEWTWHGEEDPDERRRWARQHRDEWRAVQRGEQRPPSARNELDTRGSRTFAPFRFPVVPYDALQSEFIREEIQLGSFDDLEQRQYVNKLAWIEWYTTDSRRNSFSSVTRNWRLAALHPTEYDIIRHELGEPTRDSLEPEGEIYYGDIDLETKTREFKESWRAVQGSSA